MSSIIVAGFDPASIRNLGWSLIDYNTESKEISSIAVGTFILPSVEQKWHVLWPIFCLIDQFLTTHKPDVVVVEKTSSFQGGFITGQVSHCMGAILSVCGKNYNKVSFVFPTHVKKIVCGNGKATKSEMKKSVIAKLKQMKVNNVSFDSEHSCDATANVLCWINDSLSV